jgi:hypothetical protein
MVDGPTTFNVSGYFAMDAGATIYCVPGDMPVIPMAGSPTTGGGGAGHGGAGGNDALGNSGGPVYDSTLMPALCGSNGGGNNICPGGGGLFFQLTVAGGPATLNGIINMSASSAGNCGVSPYAPDGGGSGGAIYIQADSITGSGTLTANGGNGNTSPTYGGGGGGGIIVLSHHTSDNFTGTASVSGGAAESPAQPGQNGVYNRTAY